MVFAPKYRGKMLTDDVAMVAEGVICKTCVEMGIEIIEIAVNPDHVHIFFRYLPKYSLSYIAKKLKRVSSKRLRDEFPHLKEWCSDHLWAPSCFHGSVGNVWEVVSKYIDIMLKTLATGLEHLYGVCDLRSVLTKYQTEYINEMKNEKLKKIAKERNK